MRSGALWSLVGGFLVAIAFCTGYGVEPGELALFACYQAPRDRCTYIGSDAEPPPMITSGDLLQDRG